MSEGAPGIGKAKETKAPSGTQAVIRAVRILKAVSSSEKGVSLVELCSELDLSKPTAHRILAALMSEGLVVQHPASRSFRIGPEAASLGTASRHRPDLRTLARPFLESLAAEAGETATLEVPVGDEMLILDEVESAHIIGARTEVGARWPMHATSTGKAVLAALHAADLESNLKKSRAQLTTETLADADALREELKRVRKKGFATAVGELQTDFSAVGAVVRDAGGAVAGTLSIGGPSERLPMKRLRELGRLVLRAAEALSRQLSNP